MFPAGHRLMMCCALASVFMQARAQTLIGEFALQGTLNNNVPGGTSLALLPYLGVSGNITANGYVFAKDQGLIFSSPLLTTSNYTIELSFKTNLESTTWSKLVDLSGVGANDNGLYIYNTSGYRLQFYPQAAGNAADFLAGTNFDVVLTRDSSTSTVTGYVNGQFRFSFTDSSNLAVVTAASNTITFFVDDLHTSQNEVSTGTANYIRIYNGALTATQVNTLFLAGAPSAVPEPATTSLLLALGACGALAARRHRRR